MQTGTIGKYGVYSFDGNKIGDNVIEEGVILNDNVTLIRGKSIYKATVIENRTIISKNIHHIDENNDNRGKKL